MAYRRMAMNGFLDDLFGDEEAGEGVGPTGPTFDASTPVGQGQSFWQCPSGNYPVTPQNQQNGPEPGCVPLTQVRKSDGTWGQTAGSAAATEDNPVSTFLRDLFGGGPSTPNTLPGPTTGPSVPSGGGNVLAPPPASVVSPGAAAFTVTPVHLAVGALVVLGLGYAAYKYL